MIPGSMYDGARVLVVMRAGEKIDIQKTHAVVRRYGRSRHAYFALGHRLRKSTEGLVWARGWDTENADALRAALALR